MERKASDRWGGGERYVTLMISDNNLNAELLKVLSGAAISELVPYSLNVHTHTT